MGRNQTLEQRIEKALEEYLAYQLAWQRDDRSLSASWILKGNHHTFNEMRSKVEKKRKQIAAKILKITIEAQP